MHKHSIDWRGKVRTWQKTSDSPLWYFVSVPPHTPGLGAFYMYKSTHPHSKGMVPVHVRIAYFTRDTRLFTDKENASYILPLKKSVREELHIHEGSQVAVQCWLQE